MFDAQEALIALFSSMFIILIQHDSVVDMLEKKYMGCLGAICALAFLIFLSNQKILFTDVFVVSAHKIWLTIIISEIVNFVASKYF